MVAIEISSSFSEFIDTAATDNNWVCDKAQRPTDLFTFGNVGLILGTAVFSYLADAKGRRLAFYVSTLAMIIFQLIQIAVSHLYGVYMAMKILAFACMLPLFQTPMAITTEISSIKARAFVIGFACVTWALGNMALPLIGWLIQRWKWISVASTLPMAFVFFTYRIVPESPRWLVSVGRLEDAKKVMTEIAKINKAPVPKDMEDKLKSIIKENSSEKVYGYFSLFKSYRMAMRTICVTIAFTASAFVYYQLVINIGNLAGNTYLNMFLMGLVEGPGSFIAVILSDKVSKFFQQMQKS